MFGAPLSLDPRAARGGGVRCSRALEIQIPLELPPSSATPLGAPPSRPPASPAPGGAGPARTYGWDTAFAIRLDDVNATLAQPGVCPRAFACEPEPGYAIAGEFDAWELARGGDGTNLHFRLPIAHGRLEFRGETYPLDGAAARVELRLRYRTAPPTAGAGSGDAELLVVESRAAGGMDPASVLDVEPGTTPLDSLVVALARGALTVWLNANLEKFDHVFCAVNLGAHLDDDAFGWLAPTDSGYAYVDGPDDDSSLLGVLCMTQGRAGGGRVPRLSASAIPAGARAGFSVSSGLFLREMVIPSLCKVLPGARASDFALDDDGSALTGRRELALDPIQQSGSTYHPRIEELRVELVGEELQISTRTRTRISAGIELFVRQVCFLGLELGTRSDGAPALVYVQTREPIREHWTQVAPGIQVLEVLIPIIAALVIAILSLVTGGAALIAAAIVISLVAGTAAAVPSLIADIRGGQVAERIPSLDSLVIHSTRGIRWSGATEFRLSAAALNGLLQLGGDPCFAS